MDPNRKYFYSYFVINQRRKIFVVDIDFWKRNKKQDYKGNTQNPPTFSAYLIGSEKRCSKLIVSQDWVTAASEGSVEEFAKPVSSLFLTPQSSNNNWSSSSQGLRRNLKMLKINHLMKDLGKQYLIPVRNWKNVPLCGEEVVPVLLVDGVVLVKQ